ncbi:MAG: hypothetical protein SFZ03_07615 [Candidatus Melainabacteria bacterium]|nr:hypothetical protein [Candidatus Melainabacteria bacterium]
MMPVQLQSDSQCETTIFNLDDASRCAPANRLALALIQQLKLSRQAGCLKRLQLLPSRHRPPQLSQPVCFHLPLSAGMFLMGVRQPSALRWLKPSGTETRLSLVCYDLQWIRPQGSTLYLAQRLTRSSASSSPLSQEGLSEEKLATYSSCLEVVELTGSAEQILRDVASPAVEQRLRIALAPIERRIQHLLEGGGVSRKATSPLNRGS